jgi:hypothetical protein
MTMSTGASAAALRGHTVHVAGRLTPSVFNFLCLATQSIGATDGPQTVIAIDDAFGHANLGDLRSDITVVAVPDQPSPWARSRALYHHLADVSRRTRIAAMHLHGVLPGLVGARLVRQLDDRAMQVFMSPGSARAHTGRGLLEPLLLGLVRLQMRPSRPRPLSNQDLDARVMKSLAALSVRGIESAAADVFFRTPHNEARRPLLVSGCRDESALATARFIQLAVLLGDDSLALSFNWLGPAQARTENAFRAAGIGHFRAASADERAQRLSAAWLWVAPHEERGFPIGLVEAMASGLPCVACDGESHRDVLGGTGAGFLCSSQEEMMQRVAELVDSAELRARMGEAARAVAAERFSERVFARRLLQAYGQLPGTAPPAPDADTSIERAPS